MHKLAIAPNDLEEFFVERANAGDVEGLVALYESEATLAGDDGKIVVGRDQLREYFTDYLSSHPRLSYSVQAPALCNENIALTSSRHDNGDFSAEIARRQSDGNWLWVVDQFALGKNR